MAGWQNVRVFLSSTFRDMNAERDYLIKFTFPALRERLLPYRVELYDIDLRWGITEDEAKNEQVISLCLEQIDECRPFFLAFLGHRYGWVPNQINDDTRSRFPFINAVPNVSVTELELRHGALHPENAGHSLVLLRQREALASIPEPTRTRDFLEGAPEVEAQLARLKEELQAGPFPVQPYSAEWNPQLYDRGARSPGKLDGLEGFGQQVEDWLWEAIRTELQLPETPVVVDPLQAEADLHERFLELRTRIYIGQESLYQELRQFALADGEQPLLLTGESGMGKSAALARFVRDFRQEQPDVFLLAHFVGASERTSLPRMLDRLTQELQRRFDIPLPQANSSDEIIRNFVVALTSVPISERGVLVFDALNQIDADRRAETLIWLPEVLPPNIRVICSSATGPQQAPRVLTAFGERPHIERPMQPLTLAERRAIIRAVPKLVAKTLSDAQIDALLANPATANPLYLMVALEELRGYGSFENLSGLIERLPRADDGLTKLFVRLFQRLEKEFGQDLVKRTLTLLACARRGLSDSEFSALTDDLGKAETELYPLLRQLRPYLHRREGRYDFYHMSIRRAVEMFYLQWEAEEDQHDPWLRWATERHPPTADPSEPERAARYQLIHHFQADPLSPRAVDELPWQMAQLRAWQDLFTLLGDLSFFYTAYQADEFEVRQAWSMVKQLGRFEPIDAYRAALTEPAKHDADALWRLALYLKDAGYGHEVLALWSHFIDRFRQSGEEDRLQGCLGNQALILQARGDLDGAMALHQEQEAICRRLNNPEGLQGCLGNQALILQARGDLDGAMALLHEQEAICRRLNNPDGLSISLGNQALILQARGDLDGAMALHQEQEAICRRLNNPDGLLKSLAGQALILQARGDLDGAMALHQEEEAICRRLNNPDGLQACLGNQALILRARGDLDGAMALYKEQEAICRRLNNPDGLQRSLGNQALILQARGDLDGAMALHQEEEAICRQLNNPDSLQRSLGNQALILQARGDLDGAMALHQEQEAICRRLNNPDGLSISLGNQALILQARGDLDGAMALLHEQEAICRRLDNPHGLQYSLGNQASILLERGDLDGAMALSKEQEAICRRLNNPDSLQRSLGNQALILQARGDLDGAMALHQEEEAICRRLNNPDGLQRSLGNQALILQARGDLDGAMALHQEEEVICRRLNNPDSLQRSLGNQALILKARGDLDGAMALHQEEEAICRQLNNPDSLQACLGNQALILRARGDLDGAMALHQEQEAICRRLNNPHALAISLANQAILLASNRSNPVEALPLAEEALHIANQHGYLALAKQIEPILQDIRDLLP